MRADIKAEVKVSRMQNLLWLSGVMLVSDDAVIAVLAPGGAAVLTKWLIKSSGRFRRSYSQRPARSASTSRSHWTRWWACAPRSPTTRSPRRFSAPSAAGNGVVIDDDGLVLTIGYLITEAESVWLTANARRGRRRRIALAYDHVDRPRPRPAAGAPGRCAAAALRSWTMRSSTTTSDVIGRGGRTSRAARRTNLRAPRIRGLLGVPARRGAVRDTRASGMERRSAARRRRQAGRRRLAVRSRSPTTARSSRATCSYRANSSTPILDGMLRLGRADRPPRAWLGLYTAETGDGIAIQGLAQGGPAERAGVKPGDIVSDVAGEPVAGLADFYRRIWRQRSGRCGDPAHVEP